MGKEIYVTTCLGRQKVWFLGDKEKSAEDFGNFIELPVGVWNYGAIVSALFRTKYSEDAVEAIINNNIALIAVPSAVDDEEGQQKLSEFEEMQKWREQCKARAKELLKIGEEMGVKEM